MTKKDFNKIFSHEKDIAKLSIDSDGKIRLRNLYNPEVTYKFVDGTTERNLSRRDMNDFKEFLEIEREKARKALRGVSLH